MHFLKKRCTPTFHKPLHLLMKFTEHARRNRPRHLYVLGPLSREAACQKGHEGPGDSGLNRSHRSLCCEGDTRYAGLRQAERRQQVERRPLCSVPSTGAAAAPRPALRPAGTADTDVLVSATKGLVHPCSEEGLRELGLFGPEETRLRGDVTGLYKYPKAERKADGARRCPGTGPGQWAHAGTREVPGNVRHGFPVRVTEL